METGTFKLLLISHQLQRKTDEWEEWTRKKERKTNEAGEVDDTRSCPLLIVK